MKKNMFDLSGKVAIITGTSRGLGQYMGRALAKQGADLVITSRKIARLEDFRKEIENIGGKALPVELDVRNHDSILSMTQTAIDHYGKIDILINNAGCNIRKPSVEISWEDWDTVLDTNLKGTFFVSQAVAKHMINRNHGRIINIGSVTSVFGYAGLAPYGASRGGTKQLTMSLADDWGKYGITVNCLAPGWFKTDQNKMMYENKEWLDYLVDRIPMKRPGQPNDLDGAVVFLASDAGDYITGQTLLVDGGITTGSTRALPKEKKRSYRTT